MDAKDSSGSGSLTIKSLEEIPYKYRSIFREYKTFNPVQSRCFDDVFNSDKHIVVGAPTSSGKTVIFELAIIRLLQETEKQNLPLGHYRMVYVAPIKALCKERFLDWERKFSTIGIKCQEVTGDQDINDMSDLEGGHLILTTPEKWDALTRKWRENRNYVESVKLFMVDEIHLLNESRRGPSLEAVISRMKTIYDVGRIFKGEDISVNSCDANQLRFVTVSATIPNIEDLATWLGHGYTDGIKYFAIPDEMRPVKLKKVVIGYECDNNISYFRFDMTLNYQLVNVINHYSDGKPTLIFCSTRRGVEMASNVLMTDLNISFSPEQHRAVIEISNQIIDTKLRNAISKGIAYHHAGLSLNDRTLVENGFRQGQIPVLLCTSTLAMGINLPAHLVIIKSTQSYQEGGASEIPQNTIFQMIGRAGRPQFDVSGVAVIMTQQQKKLEYEHLVSGTNPIESHLHKCLAEHLNSEIVLQTITDLSIAVQWIKSTFFYVRACKNPTKYGITNKIGKDRLEKKLEEMCLVAINALERHGLITKNNECVIKATPYGRLMARYYINFETIKLFGQIRGSENLPDILNLLTQAAEFSDFKLRTSDKRTLNELNRNNARETIRFQLKGRIMTVPAKISCLMQAVLGNLQVVDVSLNQEAVKIIQHSERLTKCLYDYLIIKEKEENSGYFTALFNTALITKCFEVKLWENSKYVTKQFKRIGPQMANTLANGGFATIESIIKGDPRKIELLVKKAPPFGNEIRSEALRFPSYELEVVLQSESSVKITVFQYNRSCDRNLKSKAYLFVGDNKNNLLFYRDEIKFQSISSTSADEVFQNTITFLPDTEFIICHLIHKSLIGVDKSTTLTIKTLKSQSTQKVAKTTRKKTSNAKAKKVTDFWKKTKDQNPENNSDEVSMIEESINEENYKDLFKGTVVANLTSHRSTPAIDETSNDSTAFEAVHNDDEQVESRYKIVEIREPEAKKSPSSHMEQELSQMPSLSLSDDEDVTVNEGDLMVAMTQNTVKSVTVADKTKETTFRFKKSTENKVETVLTSRQSEPNIGRSPIEPQLDREANDTTNKWKFTKPLTDYLPPRSPTPTLWTEEEEEQLNKAFYGAKPDPPVNHEPPQLLQKTTEHKEPAIKPPILTSTSTATIQECGLKFITARTALEKDIVQLGRDSNVLPIPKEPVSVPQLTERDQEKTPINEKVSYLNSFFLGQYFTPVKTNQQNTQQLFTAKNLSQFRKELKEKAGNIALVTDFVARKEENMSKLDVVDIDEFMNAEDDECFEKSQHQENNQNPVDDSLNLSSISAKMKHSQSQPRSDQEYFTGVLSQMCDHPENAKVAFDPSETWNSIADDETGEDVNQSQENNYKNLSEEEVKARMKEIEATYFEQMKVGPILRPKETEQTFVGQEEVDEGMFSSSNIFEEANNLVNFTQCIRNPPSPTVDVENEIEQDLLRMPEVQVNAVSDEYRQRQEVSQEIPFKKPQFKFGKTLGMKRGPPVIKSPNPIPSTSFNPAVIQFPSQPRRYVPTVPLSYKRPSSLPFVDPFKSRQQSAFAKQPARMRNMDSMIEIFHRDRHLIGAAAVKPSHDYIYPRPGGIRRDPEEELNNLPMFRNVSVQSFLQSTTTPSNMNEKRPQPPPIKLKPQYNPVTSYQITNLANLTASTGNRSAIIPGYYPQQKVHVVPNYVQPSNLMLKRTATTQDPLFWMQQPPEKIFKADYHDQRNLFEKKDNRASSTFAEHDPLFWLNGTSETGEQNFFEDNVDSGFPF